MKRRGFIRISLLMAALLAVPFSVWAKAAFWGGKAMIRQAQIIAIVNITEIKPVSVKRDGWTYSEAATAKVEAVLKGELAETVTLHGGEDFICAQIHYKPGRHLVFLRHDRDLLRGVNWHLGGRPIKDDQLDWFVNDEKLELKPTALEEVRQQIKAVLAVNSK